MQTYVFFRKEGFYFVELKDDADAVENAHHNAGTLRVETLGGREVFNINKTH